MLGTPFLRRVKANIDFNGLGSIVINGETIDNDLSVWLTSNEAKIHGMLANKVTRQGGQPLELIVDQLSNNTKEFNFETIKNELLVVPVPHTVKELQKLISMVAYMLPYCGRIKQPLDMLRCIYRDKPYVCNEDVYNVILDINSALSTTNIVNYYGDIVIHDGYTTHHNNNIYSTKATVSGSDYKKSLNDQKHSGVSIEEVNEENDNPNIIVNNDILEDHNVLIHKTTPTLQEPIKAPSRDIAPTSGIEMFNRKERRIISSARVSLQLTKDDFSRLRSQWKEKYVDLFSDIPLELPPMREVNHRIKLIDPDK
ncbi:hypothetical protein M422DRAFT_254004 [Sphaerobolus stellatus SS14]|uniref:Uncharacterized protein n=1 Tax=Sphaerobolus stellatus (strain SS14) TaxID=990650 RepID=A0A0C9V7C1_SPHS4|nr:hypothetical protein M422DRAFT_254004 [Sphaerobolus stellatus SS14]